MEGILGTFSRIDKDGVRFDKHQAAIDFCLGGSCFFLSEITSISLPSILSKAMKTGIKNHLRAGTHAPNSH